MDIMETLANMTLPATAVKQRLPELLKKVNLYHEGVMITKNGTLSGVLLGISEYETLLESLEILSNPKLMRSLQRSQKQAKGGKLYQDDEVWD